MSREKEKKPQWVNGLLNEPVMDYTVYEMSASEKLLYTVIAFIAGGALGMLFYSGMFKNNGEPTTLTYIANTVAIVVGGIVAVRFFLPLRADQLQKKRKMDLRKQFRDMLESVTTSLASGSTVQDAFIDAQEDMKNQYSENSYISRELDQIVVGSGNNISIERLIDNLAERSGIDDIKDFSNVFKVARQPGGNIADIMRQTHSIIGEKMAIEDEIESKMSSNKLELNVIMVAPVLVVGVMRMSSGSFAENLASPKGALASTVAIILFLCAWRLGQKIISSVR